MTKRQRQRNYLVRHRVDDHARKKRTREVYAYDRVVSKREASYYIKEATC
jgi:hypothetical protein